MIIRPHFSNDPLPLQEYPRPQFRRDSYLSLNGTWEYAFAPSPDTPARWDGQILVPYSPESAYSGVGRQLRPDEFLHYRRFFTLPAGFLRGRLLLQVGACDQVCTVFCNGKEVGGHEGGYLPFTLDLTDALTPGENELRFVVTDDAASPVYGRGKQSYQSGGIWYTAVSGIWQSVWLESVPMDYLHTLCLEPDAAEKTLALSCRVHGEALPVRYDFYDGDTRLGTVCAPAGERAVWDASACKLWTPETPELYRIVITAGEDRVESYFGLRSFSRVRRGGRPYFALNGTPVFQSGLLDQGYWGEGIYTPASNREMFDCLQRVKSLGFNMLRKHIKIEPLLWYYYCDILGILVWQDMVNGGDAYSRLRITLCPFIDLHLDDRDHKKMGREDPRSRAQFLREAEDTIGHLSCCVCICLWTPFNEAWGQFDAIDVCRRLRAVDGTRLYDHASGWQDMGGGDLCSRHIYFRKVRLHNDGRRILALTEFGGYAYAKGKEKRGIFSYRTYRTRQAFTRALDRLYRKQILPAVQKDGLCAIVYTQLADVETERNGIFTADGKLKTDADGMRALNAALHRAFAEALPPAD